MSLAKCPYLPEFAAYSEERHRRYPKIRHPNPYFVKPYSRPRCFIKAHWWRHESSRWPRCSWKAEALRDSSLGWALFFHLPPIHRLRHLLPFLLPSFFDPENTVTDQCPFYIHTLLHTLRLYNYDYQSSISGSRTGRDEAMLDINIRTNSH